MRTLAALLAVLVAASLIGSIAVVRWIHRPGQRWRDVARARLVYGIPWGSLVVIAFVLAVYLFVQSGLADFDDPVTIPFRTWSYFYPLGMATASFSHAGPGHLIGNLAGTAVVAPIAEYAWGHYPDERDPVRTDSWAADPRVRAVVVFPLVVIGVGLVMSLFALGPVIGFSGVVFALAGFALVQYPILTIIATLGVQDVVLRLYYALQEPIRVYTAAPRPPSAPSWAGIAIQGHALGLFVGFVLGVALLKRRHSRPDPLRLWLAVLLFGFSRELWAIYWFGAENTFILYQGPGVAIVSILALVVTLSMTAPDTPLLPPPLRRLVAQPVDDESSPVTRPLELAGSARDRVVTARLERVREIIGAGQDREPGLLATLTRRRAAFLAVLGVLAILAGIAVPANFLAVDDATAASDSPLQIRDYTVEYVEGVPNEYVSGIGIEAIESDDGLESSGVIVASEQREIWLEAVSTQRLAFTGEETITVGGPGWRETVHVDRSGWEPVGNDTVYQVWLWEDGTDRQLAYESNDSRADVRIAGRNVTIGTDDGTFDLAVNASEDTATATTAIPAENETTTAGGLTFERDGETIYAAADGTRVAIASKETYNGF
ncbi:membrane associated rhomboid family serine protease [Natrinema hispanicum]|uniref:Membrane associated rhomboid family serine protease n=1 Tax=Natrinema hispanicum TaxID=392421 RepID=A0A482Y5Y2_9EURY|nr:rhomboid family intramembrane serine protease [Natrinema hispanicum]RZV08243.1 membrane associated rhomboid family serine protease [Natrinema hispanicum]